MKDKEKKEKKPMEKHSDKMSCKGMKEPKGMKKEESKKKK